MHPTTPHLRALRATIGRNIRAERSWQRMTLRKLARLSGVAEGRIDQFELGKSEIGWMNC